MHYQLYDDLDIYNLPVNYMRDTVVSQVTSTIKNCLIVMIVTLIKLSKPARASLATNLSRRQKNWLELIDQQAL